jgi:phage I-like protein
VLNAILHLAKSSSLASGDGSVQMFPPGRQVVTPSRADGEEPEELELVIDEKTAHDLEAVRSALQAKADAGEGDAPYFDFNHGDGEASAWPKRIYWAGDDPLLGGVRAEVEWTAAGDAAVQGKTYRRFSPAFYAHEGRITGAPVNMGGLVNRAAFTRIQSLFAKENLNSQNSTLKPEATMTQEEITALQEENASLKNQLAELQASVDGMKKKDAEATVEQAAKEGRIGTDPVLKAKWVDSITKDAAAKDLLLAMAPNPALTAKITDNSKDISPDETPEKLLAKFNELPRTEREAFFAKHRPALIAARDATLRG